MSNSLLIIGESGTGKTYSLRNLNPAETFIIRSVKKPLPIKGWVNKYNADNKNIYDTDNPLKILEVIKRVSDNAPHVKQIIIDDYNYCMSNNLFRADSSKTKGTKVFTFYTDLARETWALFSELGKFRDDLTIVIMAHTSCDDAGVTKMKTVGKMIDKDALEGRFTYIFQSLVINREYKFLTQNINGDSICKSPPEIFDCEYIDNDINFAINKINEHENG